MSNYLQIWLRNLKNTPFSDISVMLKSFGVYTKRHQKYPNLVQFVYDQIESYPHRHLALTQISRGIILNEADNWNVVCYPFNRFFNYGEDVAAKIDPKTMQVYEKVDGSLCSIYWYDSQWNVCTRNSPDASGSIGEDPRSFSKLFWKVFEEEAFDINTLDKSYTFMFELTTPENMVVVSHKESKLTLLGLRNNITQYEVSPDVYPQLNPVRKFFLRSFDEVLKASEELDPIQQEGYVICDAFFNRVKVKSPKYVALHHMVSDFSIRNCIRLIKLGEESELFAYYPQYKDKYYDIKFRIEAYIKSVETDWENLHKVVTELYGPNFTQKEFTQFALKSTNSGIIFSVRKGEYPDVRTAVMDKSEYKIEEFIGV